KLLSRIPPSGQGHNRVDSGRARPSTTFVPDKRVWRWPKGEPDLPAGQKSAMPAQALGIAALALLAFGPGVAQERSIHPPSPPFVLLSPPSHIHLFPRVRGRGYGQKDKRVGHHTRHCFLGSTTMASPRCQDCRFFHAYPPADTPGEIIFSGEG